ncbi:MAG TPA: outer membrane protein assembly factor BamD [Alteromonas australica]|jgi:outer membrane protein assembly factor BamD|uniref:Outer membrane protein assembly factor BamD n=1 Tax=Alteromonas australica TaxID=589873 RepID=A0A075P7Y8_9ALTE|nr:MULTISPECIES: outer membrane protein assembly factor BamD [Alteromonas]MAO28775.1 outer membrane protein assembly factor BamD [Alteromonas sp.]AIF99427.1 membrane protein [Alteromonas australica]AJP44441.1 membrane protein [Alteromonas australica]QPL51300.1 outer membrane protein assembly factor BamD [Alteromonas sp. B31-7]HAI70896.1 outer membrane protein assembly factor BamD [Alteromonas australica]|tara:strand:- start:1095 stop:1862 length:768 start_codon:yes stop_codon:yes gene_type:complete
MKSFRLLAPVVLGAMVSVAGCSSSADNEEKAVLANMGAQQLYERAKQSMEVGNFSAAAQTLSALDSRYPFGPLSHQVQLDLIYSYYKSGKNEETIATIDRFIRLNPNHSDVDYAYYMRGLTNMEADSNLFQELMNIDRTDRDPSMSREAFEDFRRLIQQYPESKYAVDARKRMLHIKDRLARYEIAIARFYMRRQAYVAAANRGRYVLEHFPDTTQVQQALEIMVSSYEQLGLDELRENALKTLRLNYPDSEYIS